MGIYAIVLILLAVIGLAAWVRLVPVDPGRWHVDPMEAEAPGAGGWLVRSEGGDTAWPAFDVTGETLLTAFDAVAMAEPRTERIAGSVGEGRITYITRSALWGFPDFATVTTVPDGQGATLAVLSRLRFGKSDMGVNRARIERWLEALRQRLALVEPG
ncbi:DUF1499 domain-containing protein [Oceaniglobus trochenteri]|uniref:DUF1499 domain-containing protein n=1 Tax=Oceaniglobus trochenteri TaxID=2763260 RepID=UPI001CFFC4BD|nr:DUF1499 domain-containing protein [Oceaniglobus trochenteri]